MRQIGRKNSKYLDAIALTKSDNVAGTLTYAEPPELTRALLSTIEADAQRSPTRNLHKKVLE